MLFQLLLSTLILLLNLGLSNAAETFSKDQLPTLKQEKLIVENAEHVGSLSQFEQLALHQKIFDSLFDAKRKVTKEEEEAHLIKQKILIESTFSPDKVFELFCEHSLVPFICSNPQVNIVPIIMHWIPRISPTCRLKFFSFLNATCSDTLSYADLFPEEQEEWSEMCRIKDALIEIEEKIRIEARNKFVSNLTRFNRIRDPEGSYSREVKELFGDWFRSLAEMIAEHNGYYIQDAYSTLSSIVTFKVPVQKQASILNSGLQTFKSYVIGMILGKVNDKEAPIKPVEMQMYLELLVEASYGYGLIDLKASIDLHRSLCMTLYKLNIDWIACDTSNDLASVLANLLLDRFYGLIRTTNSISHDWNDIIYRWSGGLIERHKEGGNGFISARNIFAALLRMYINTAGSKLTQKRQLMYNLLGDLQTIILSYFILEPGRCWNSSMKESLILPLARIALDYRAQPLVQGASIPTHGMCVKIERDLETPSKDTFICTVFNSGFGLDLAHQKYDAKRVSPTCPMKVKGDLTTLLTAFCHFNVTFDDFLFSEDSPDKNSYINVIYGRRLKPGQLISKPDLSKHAKLKETIGRQQAGTCASSGSVAFIQSHGEEGQILALELRMSVSEHAFEATITSLKECYKALKQILKDCSISNMVQFQELIISHERQLRWLGTCPHLDYGKLARYLGLVILPQCYHDLKVRVEEEKELPARYKRVKDLFDQGLMGIRSKCAQKDDNPCVEDFRQQALEALPTPFRNVAKSISLEKKTLQRAQPKIETSSTPLKYTYELEAALKAKCLESSSQFNPVECLKTMIELLKAPHPDPRLRHFINSISKWKKDVVQSLPPHLHSSCTVLSSKLTSIDQEMYNLCSKDSKLFNPLLGLGKILDFLRTPAVDCDRELLLTLGAISRWDEKIVRSIPQDVSYLFIHALWDDALPLVSESGFKLNTRTFKTILRKLPYSPKLHVHDIKAIISEAQKDDTLESILEEFALAHSSTPVTIEDFHDQARVIMKYVALGDGELIPAIDYDPTKHAEYIYECTQYLKNDPIRQDLLKRVTSTLPNEMECFINALDWKDFVQSDLPSEEELKRLIKCLRKSYVQILPRCDLELFSFRLQKNLKLIKKQIDVKVKEIEKMLKDLMETRKGHKPKFSFEEFNIENYIMEQLELNFIDFPKAVLRAKSLFQLKKQGKESHTLFTWFKEYLKHHLDLGLETDESEQAKNHLNQLGIILKNMYSQLYWENKRNETTCH